MFLIIRNRIFHKNGTKNLTLDYMKQYNYLAFEQILNFLKK